MQSSKLQFKIQKLKNAYHLFIAVLANIRYGFPSRRLKIIGVTGTDGKTTTTHLIYHILKTAGKKVSMVSSVYAKIGEKEYDTGFHVTTPSPFDVQKLLRAASDHDDEYFVLETTAHGLDQNRVCGINYAISVLTNVTHEHLSSVGGYDYFRSMNNYLNAKVRLLKNSKIAITNIDDDSFKKIKNQKKICKLITYGLAKKADYQWNNNIISNLYGDYNRYNILAAVAVASELGIPKNKIYQAVKSFQLPQGRFELVYDKEFKVIIDFAHTINGINQVLSTIRTDFLKETNGKLIHVFGAAGLRDSLKRPAMGEASAKYAGLIILTEEDYRTEDPNKICQQIAQGIKNKKYLIIVDRQQAINKAVSLAKKGDIVVVTGKGHEKSLCRGKKEYPWDERIAVKKALQLKFKTYDNL